MGRTNNEIRLVVPPLGGDKPLYEQGLTIIHPYFGEVKRFNFMYENYWSKYPQAIKDKLTILIVDDFGTPPIHTLMSGRSPDFKLVIWRIMDDLKYNTPGALNLGSVKAETNQIFQMDSDCAMETDMLDSLMKLAPLPLHMYKFRRNRITNDPKKKLLTRYLPCANLMDKQTFECVGGFDEDFTGSRSGGYGYFDNHFDFVARKKAIIGRAVIDGIIVTEYLESLVENKPTGPQGVGVHRTTFDQKVNRKLLRAKQTAYPVMDNKEILRFKYEKVYESGK